MARIQLLYFDIDSGYYHHFHHGLASLMGALKQARQEVFFSYLKDESDYLSAIGLFKKEGPDVIGLSFTTNQQKYVRRFLDQFSFSGKLLVAGGIHCTILKEKIFDVFPEVEGVCIGDGEEALASLCLRIDQEVDYRRTPSFYFKTSEGVIKNEMSPLPDIDSLAMPDYSLFPYEKIIRENGLRFPMMISRGCCYDCYYCCNHVLREVYTDKHRYMRFLTPQKAIEVIKNNLLLYPRTERIHFLDDTFTVNRLWLIEFCKLYKKEIGLPFRCNARVETINKEVLNELQEARCDLIGFGIESGNEWLRKHILNKDYSNEAIKSVFNMIKQRGIKTVVYNIFGFPFETKKMMKDTLNLTIELRPHMGKCFYFFPYPLTKIHQLCIDYHFLLDNIDERSNFLEGPTLHETFSSHKEIRKYYQATQLFLFLRGLTYRLRLSAFLEVILFRAFSIFRGPAYALINPLSKNKFVLVFRDIGRKIMSRYAQ